MADFTTWLTQALDDLGADSEVFGEYVRGIMDDSGEGSIEERADAAVGALSAAVEDEDALEALRTQLVDKWTAHEQANSRAQQAAAAAKVAKQQADAEAVRSAMRREVEESKKREEEKAKIVLSEDELARRAALLNMYGYVDTADGDDGKQEDDDDMGDLAKSDNAELVRAKARAQKDAQKQKHDEEQVRIRAQQEAERAKREKKKEKAPKKERRAGRG